MAQHLVESESTEGRGPRQRFGAQGVSALPTAAARQAARSLFEARQGRAPADAMLAVARTAIQRLAGRPAQPSGARVREPLGLPEAASVAARSPSRFWQLFVQEAGSSFRACLLWPRLDLAVESAMAGASWTEAAHATGFADPAHLARTRLLGRLPGALRREATP